MNERDCNNCGHGPPTRDGSDDACEDLDKQMLGENRRDCWCPIECLDVWEEDEEPE